MKNKGEFYLKKLIAGKGCYVHVILEAKIELNCNSNLEIYYEYEELERWKPVIDFGILYLTEKLRKQHTNFGISVKIIDIDHQIIDTTNIIVLYGFLKAISSAINFDIDNHINIDESECKFCFLK